MVLAILLSGSACISGLLYFGIHGEPGFYSAALEIDQKNSRESGDQFEYQILSLQNDIRNEGFWFATFTERQVNGWLATDLVEKFPEALPPGVESPRIAISEDRLHLGFRLKNSVISGVISLGGELFRTDQPNQIGFRLDYVRVGWIPLPIGQWADNIASHFNAVGLPMSWTEFEGSPAALVQLPNRLQADNSLSFSLSSFELRNGALCIGGYSSSGQSAYLAAQQFLADSLNRVGMITKLQQRAYRSRVTR
jgi:hypothetical protein